MLRSVALDDLRVLAVTGNDRVTFLQGQLTQDIAKVMPAQSSLCGWADAKGRLLYAGHLLALDTDGEEALALLLPAELAETLFKRLRMYVLRSKVVLTLLDKPVIGLFDTPDKTAPGQAIRLYGNDERYLAFGPLAGAGNCSRNDWQLADIRAGIPEIRLATSGEFVPQMANLDLLDGISFSKGCYTGQEIVARMKYLGRVKRRMLRFSAAASPPPPGTSLFVGRGVAGKVVSSASTDAGTEFLAVVVLDDLPGPFHLDAEATQPAQQLDLPYNVLT